MNNGREWIIDWFVKNSKLSEEEILANINENYIDIGLVDSFGFLQLLSDITEEFGIDFSDEDFNSEIFFTISGLGEYLRGINNE